MNTITGLQDNPAHTAQHPNNQEDNTMAFVNEYIPEADLVKYGIEEIDKRFIVGNTHDHSWTIDRERDIYLRCVARGREEASHKSTWTFYWGGELMAVCLETVDAGSDGTRNGRGWVRYQLVDCYLKGFFIPSHLLDRRDEIIADLREALTARKGGINSAKETYETTLAI